MVGSSVAVADSCSGLRLFWVEKIKLPFYLLANQAYQFTKWTITFLFFFWLFFIFFSWTKESQQWARLLILERPSKV